jgi:hypothetical protein
MGTSIKSWFSGIKTKDQAVNVVRETSYLALTVGGIDIAVGIVLSAMESSFSSVIIDGITLASVGVWLLWRQSRTAAVAFLMLALLGLSVIIAKLNQVQAAGANIWVMAIVIFAAIKAVEATFKLKGRFRNWEPAR